MRRIRIYHLQPTHRSIRISNTLINPHNVQALPLNKLNSIPKIRNRTRTQIVQDSQITPALNVPNKSLQLLLGRICISPKPVLDIDAPVNDIGVA